MSTRSDVDLLLVTGNHVTPEDVRDYALQVCPALDFFFVDGGLAVSCANGSKVKARSQKDLIRRLGALKLWDRKTGFLEVDVDWKFEVIKGHTPIYTTLVSGGPFPSKAEAIASVPPRESVDDQKEEHTLVAYWSRAEWSERFGMLGVFGAIFVVGLLCGKTSFFSKLYDLIKEVLPK